MTTTTVTACLVIAAALAACGGGRTSGTPAPSRGELTAEEIMSVSVSSLYDVIRIRRSEWLRRSATRPTTFREGQSADLVVYLDGHRFGDAEALRQITPASVRTVRFLTPSEAEMRYGLNLLGGVIDVVSQGTSGQRP